MDAEHRGERLVQSGEGGIEKKGIGVIVQKQSIITTSPTLRIPHVMSSIIEFIEYANLYGVEIDLSAVVNVNPDQHRSQKRYHPQRPANQSAEPNSSNEPILANSIDRSEHEELKAKIGRLRAAGKTVIEQRNVWQQRALEAEANVKALKATLGKLRGTGGDDKKFDELRRFLAREFHPDHSKSEGIEKILRAEMFKNIWPKVEDIAKSKP